MILQMVNHIFLARLFLICLVIIAVYTIVVDTSPDEVKLLPCLFHSVTDVPCPGCGMTRACLSLSHGQFTDALRYHPFSFVIVGLAIIIAIFPSRFKDVWSGLSSKTQSLIGIFGVVLCLSVWIMKLTSIIE